MVLYGSQEPVERGLFSVSPAGIYSFLMGFTGRTRATHKDGYISIVCLPILIIHKPVHRPHRHRTAIAFILLYLRASGKILLVPAALWFSHSSFTKRLIVVFGVSAAIGARASLSLICKAEAFVSIIGACKTARFRAITSCFALPACFTTKINVSEWSFTARLLHSRTPQTWILNQFRRIRTYAAFILLRFGGGSPSLCTNRICLGTTGDVMPLAAAQLGLRAYGQNTAPGSLDHRY